MKQVDWKKPKQNGNPPVSQKAVKKKSNVIATCKQNDNK